MTSLTSKYLADAMNEIGSPRPNAGEGLGVRGTFAAAPTSETPADSDSYLIVLLREERGVGEFTEN